MSPSWHERIHAVLMPDRVTVRRFARGLTRRVTASEEIPADISVGTSAVGALADCLKRWNIRGARIEIVMSGEFARYLVLPGGELFDDTQLSALARIVSRRTYGAVADKWTFCLSPADSGDPILACGIDTDLLTRLREAAGAHGRLTSLRPLLMDAANRYRRQIGSGQGCLAIAEPRRVSLGWLHNGRWKEVVGRSVSADLQEVDHILAEHLALHGAENPGIVWFCDLTGALRPQLPASWTLVSLPVPAGVRHAGDAVAAWEDG